MGFNTIYYWYPFDRIFLLVEANFLVNLHSETENTVHLPASFTLSEDMNSWRGIVRQNAYKGPTLSASFVRQKPTSSHIVFKRPIATIAFTIAMCTTLALLPIALLLISEKNTLVEILFACFLGVGTWQMRNYIFPEPAPQLTVIDVYLIAVFMVIVGLILYRLLHTENAFTPKTSSVKSRRAEEKPRQRKKHHHNIRNTLLKKK